MSNKTSETHPWHLHGHDFWVLGNGEGKFDIYSDPKEYNLVDPIMKNTWAWELVFAEGIARLGESPSSIKGCVHRK
ncbi:hypothetical protein WN943_023829 [Citrus x changshan-huyou]